LNLPSWVIPPKIAVSEDKPKVKKLKGVEMIGRSIYLDMQATTPVDPRVLDAMLPHYTELFGNPHSRTHLYGWETEEAIERAREVRFSLIHSHSSIRTQTQTQTQTHTLLLFFITYIHHTKCTCRGEQQTQFFFVL
jgi:cysteine desulfurase